MSKWTATDAGPRQVSAFNKAWRHMLFVGQTITEITGVHGQPETQKSWSCTPMMGQSSPECQQWAQTIGTAFHYTISRDNAAGLVKAIEAATAEIEKTPMIVDKRITAEQKADDDRANTEFKAKQAAEASARATERETCIARLRADYPFAAHVQSKGLSNQARAAACIKHELAAAFPGIKFSVKSSGFAGGDSVDIYWDLGPTTAHVKAISGKYAYGWFDGSDDSYNLDRTAFSAAVGEVLGQSKYVMENRRLPDGMFEAISQYLAGQYKDATADDQSVRHNAWKLIEETAFAPGEAYAGVEWSAEQGGFRIIKTASTPQTTSPADTDTNTDTNADIVSESGATITHNTERDGIEIRFADKPARHVIDRLKSDGWRWSFHAKCWYKRNRPGVREFAEQFVTMEAVA